MGKARLVGCPYCDSETKVGAKKNYICLSCFNPFFYLNEKIYKEDPRKTIIGYYNILLSERLSKENMLTVGAIITNKSVTWGRALKVAEHIISIVDDVELVRHTFTIQFTDKLFAWRNRNNFSSMLVDFDAAYTIAKAIQEQEEEKRKNREKFDEVRDRMYNELFGGGK